MPQRRRIVVRKCKKSHGQVNARDGTSDITASAARAASFGQLMFAALTAGTAKRRAAFRFLKAQP